MPEILVVDDAMIDLKLAARLLEQQEGWSVRCARDGAEALAQIEAHLPNLVVTDLQMPELNGLQLVERMRAEFPLIPVILMTAAGSEQIAVEAIQKGAASYVPKRELAADLVKTAVRVLAAAEERRERRRLMNYLTEVNYVLDNDLELLSAVVRELRQIIRDRRFFDDSQCLQFASAVDEALVNAYFHGNLEITSELRIQDAEAYHAEADRRRVQEQYKDRRIRYRLIMNKWRVSVWIGDEGPGFNKGELPDPTAPGFLDRPCGRGVMLMRAFSDELQFNEKGNEVTLIKYRVAPPHEVAQTEGA